MLNFDIVPTITSNRLQEIMLTIYLFDGKRQFMSSFLRLYLRWFGVLFQQLSDSKVVYTLIIKSQGGWESRIRRCVVAFCHASGSKRLSQ